MMMMGWMEKKGTPLPPSHLLAFLVQTLNLASEKRHLPPSLFPFPFVRPILPDASAFIGRPHACAHTHDARCHHGRLIPAFFAFFSSLGLRRRDGRAEKRLRERIARPPRNELSPSVVVRLEDVAEGPVSGVVRASPSQGASCPLVKRLFRQNCLFQAPRSPFFRR